MLSGADTGQAAGPAAPVLELRDGTVVLAGRPVLRGIDLAVPAGQFLALLGANGSGKSTLVRAAVGLLSLTRGEARLFGTPVDSFRAWHRVGYVPQRATAASGVPVSVTELVASGRLTRRRPLRPASRADRAAVADALEAVGLADRASERIATLSGGQQQRALIARALAGDAELFLLDEPTAGVDVASQQALADALRLLSDRGATVVLVAHDLGPLAELVDRAVLLHDGRVAHDGAPPEAGQGDHHHPAVVPHDHAPHVASPLEGTP